MDTAREIERLKAKGWTCRPDGSGLWTVYDADGKPVVSDISEELAWLAAIGRD